MELQAQADPSKSDSQKKLQVISYDNHGHSSIVNETSEDRRKTNYRKQRECESRLEELFQRYPRAPCKFDRACTDLCTPYQTPYSKPDYMAIVEDPI